MTPRAWLATWAEVGSLIAEHIGEGLTMLARAIDPPPEVVKWVRVDPDAVDDPADDAEDGQEGATYVVQLTPGAVRVGWCATCLVSHAFLDMYVRPDEPPVATWADHNEEDE